MSSTTHDQPRPGGDGSGLSGRSLQWFAQLAGDWNPRDLRDGGGFAELLAALTALGARHGDIWFNHKPRQEDPEAGFRRFGRNDLLVMPTRPPLHDKGEGQPRRHLRPSNTSFEHLVHAPFQLFFKRCARNAVTLAEEPAKRLPPDKQNRRSTTYYQYTRNGLEVTWAFYKSLEGRKPPGSKDRTTAVFLAHVPALWQEGPALLSAFGMGANETLLWCHILRTRKNDLLRDVLSSSVPRFIMCELWTNAAWTSEPLRAPLDLLTLTDAASHWQVEPIVDWTPAAWAPPVRQVSAGGASRLAAVGGAKLTPERPLPGSEL
jgi:hypothetical protein